VALDPRTPVVVGVGQRLQRPADVADALEPVGLMALAVEAAGADAGAPGLLAKTQLVAVVRGFWRYPDPGRLVAERIGATNARTLLSEDGGNTPQSLVNALAARIAAGALDVAVVVGAETVWSKRRAKAQGVKSNTTIQVDVEPDEQFGDELLMSTEAERDQGVWAPVHMYPLFETALRHQLGESLEAHAERVAALWARFNAVAVDNPYAWIRTPMTAGEIGTPAPKNRMVNYPYTKSENSNWDLDQSAALVLCSAGAAAAAGVPKDRWVFPHAGTDAHDTPFLSNRDNLHSSPAIRLAARRALAAAGCGVDDFAHIDVYSCFPSAVQIAAREIGLDAHDPSRPLTVTGGLSFAGGPANNYVTHSIATMASRLRDEAGGALGLVTANGGALTKHAIGVYGTEPPAGGFTAEDVQPAVDACPVREAADEHQGPVAIEAYTVMHDHGGPERALFALLTTDGRRAWGHSTDATVMATVMATDAVGLVGRRDPSGALRLG
jgi:acetyl-CoA C-acetyltransferase